MIKSNMANIQELGDNEDNLSYSFSARFKNFAESLPVLSIDEIILPPAPAPSET